MKIPLLHDEDKSLEVLTEVVEDSETQTGKNGSNAKVTNFAVQLPEFKGSGSGQKAQGIEDDDNLVHYCEDEISMNDHRYVKEFTSQSFLQPHRLSSVGMKQKPEQNDLAALPQRYCSFVQGADGDQDLLDKSEK